MPSPSRYVFVWENIGPTHMDRLRALADVSPAGAVLAIEHWGISAVYDWEPARAAGVEVRTLNPRPSPLARARLAWTLLRECLAHRKAAFFLCHYESVATFIVACILRLLGRPVNTMIDSKFDDFPRRLPRQFVKAIFLWPYHGAIAAGRRSRDYLTFLGKRPDRIALGYDTLSVDRIVALSGSPPAPDGVPFSERDFVVVARHVPKKNIAMALEAFAIWLGRTTHPRDLHLCGSGPLEQALRKKAAELGIAERVHFRGFLQTADVARVLARSLCLLLTSTEEQFGLVVIEAQALGLPVILSSNAGAADTLIDCGVNGFTLDPEKPASCAALMLLLSGRARATATREPRYRGDARHFASAVLSLASRDPEPPLAPQADGIRSAMPSATRRAR